MLKFNINNLNKHLYARLPGMELPGCVQCGIQSNRASQETAQGSSAGIWDGGTTAPPSRASDTVGAAFTRGQALWIHTRVSDRSHGTGLARLGQGRKFLLNHLLPRTVTAVLSLGSGGRLPPGPVPPAAGWCAGSPSGSNLQ